MDKRILGWVPWGDEVAPFNCPVNYSETGGHRSNVKVVLALWYVMWASRHGVITHNKKAILIQVKVYIPPWLYTALYSLMIFISSVTVWSSIVTSFLLLSSCNSSLAVNSGRGSTVGDSVTRGDNSSVRIYCRVKYCSRSSLVHWMVIFTYTKDYLGHYLPLNCDNIIFYCNVLWNSQLIFQHES